MFNSLHTRKKAPHPAYMEIIPVAAVKPLENYRLWLEFRNGEKRIYDFKPLLERRIFQPLKDKAVFDGVCVGNGETATWLGGTIDIAPETLYYEGVPVA